MSFMAKRSLTAPVLMLLFVLIIASTAVSAQTKTGVSTARVDFGTLGPGWSAARDVILTNPGSNSTVTYTINIVNVSNASGQLTATPSFGSIAPRSNVTIVVRLDVPSDAKEGSFSSSIVVNESKVSNSGGKSTVLPTLVGQVNYAVQSNAAGLITLSDVDVPLVAGVFGVFALLAIVAVYVILRKL